MEYAIEINGLKKEYRLGTIGGGTLTADLQSFIARKRGKEDPNAVIGEGSSAYGQRFLALNGIDLKVKPGEAVGIIGHNGAGKSTLLKILSRVTAPTEGTAILNGRVSSMLEVGTGFHPELTGRENIYMNGAILGMSRKEVDAKIEEIIDFSECRKFIDTPVKRYSSGMYVKLAFAVAAHLDAEIMIMDEVLAVGDVKFQKKCLSRMDDAAHGEGKTVLYVSHNMATIRQLCNRCIVLNHGQIIFDGDVEEAIAIYIDQDRSDFPAKYDLSESKRPSADFGTYMRVMDFTFEGRERAIYKQGEPITYSFSYDCQGSGQEFGVYYTVCHEDGTIIGTEFSEGLGLTDSSKRQKRLLQADFTGLIPGNYYFYFDVFYRNEFGTIYSVDHPEQKIHFQVAAASESDGVNWVRKDFGSVRFPNIQKLDEKDD